MANDFAGEKFAAWEASENRPFQFFANKNQAFYGSGNIKMPSKW